MSMTSPTSPADPAPDSSGVSLVLVSGSGRSGTSSLAGSLKRLGLHVPQPEVEASETNPRGFYEPKWVIDFHKGYLKQLAMHNIDSRPDAPALVAELAATGEPQRRLKEWLSGQLDHPRLVVKDPHAFWFAEVWGTVCADLGVDLKWLTALRHPAEVVGSRDIAYLQSQSEELRLVKETSNVAGWVNAALLTERAGRGTARSFIRYGDLLADWRTALARVGQQLDLTYDADLADPAPHPVDEFIEPSMRKSQLTWDDLHLPAHLRDTAQEVWDLLGQLVEEPTSTVATKRLDQIQADYAARYAEAVALTYDHSKAEAVLAARKARDVQRATMQDLRRQLREAEQRAAHPERRSLLDRLPGRGRRG